ncbi:MAG: Tar ligand binding domain-containing protein [Nitrospiraceae bacterium]
MSLLIAVGGLVSSHILREIDRDLRVLYADYTLAATDLGHISADVMRYRNTIIRALEAPTLKDFERISASLPDQRVRILKAVDRYAAASGRVSRKEQSEAQDLQAVRDSLATYFSAADVTIALLTNLWRATSPQEAGALRSKAEVHAAENAGPKLIQVSLALDRLLETVAEVARDLQAEGSRAIRTASAVLIIGCFLLALLVLSVQRLPPSPSIEPQSVLREPDRSESPSFLHSVEEDHAGKFSVRKL